MFGFGSNNNNNNNNNNFNHNYSNNDQHFFGREKRLSSCRCQNNYISTYLSFRHAIELYIFS